MENAINVTPGFCPNCGTILPPLKAQGGVTCFLCSKEFEAAGELLWNLLIDDYFT
jgi:hypothetical protein